MSEGKGRNSLAAIIDMTVYELLRVSSTWLNVRGELATEVATHRIRRAPARISGSERLDRLRKLCLHCSKSRSIPSSYNPFRQVQSFRTCATKVNLQKIA